jgi:membrane-associated phospholipid phosphatase
VPWLSPGLDPLSLNPLSGIDKRPVAGPTRANDSRPSRAALAVIAVVRGPVRARVGLAALAFVVVYIVAVGTAPGRHIDVLLLRVDFGSGPLYRAAAQLLEAITWLSVGASGIAIALWALRRDGAGRAGRILVGLAGTYASSLAISLVLERVDPLGGEAQRHAAGFYPSGHAAMVAALALAAVATAPATMRRFVAVVAAAAVGTVGVVIVVLHSHYPSDVVGGWLLAVAWMAAALESFRGGVEHQPRRSCERLY